MVEGDESARNEVVESDDGDGHEADDAPLSAKRQRFVEEYLVDLNGTKAAIRASYAAGSAYTVASRLLRNAQVKAAIDAGIKERRAHTAGAAERLRRELELIAYSDVGDVLVVQEDGTVQVKPFEEMSPEARRAIGEITQTVTERFEGGQRGEVPSTIEKVRTGLKHHSKVAAIKMLMELDGLVAPKQLQHTGKDGGPIETSSAVRYVFTVPQDEPTE